MPGSAANPKEKIVHRTVQKYINLMPVAREFGRKYELIEGCIHLLREQPDAVPPSKDGTDKDARSIRPAPSSARSSRIHTGGMCDCARSGPGFRGARSVAIGDTAFADPTEDVSRLALRHGHTRFQLSRARHIRWISGSEFINQDTVCETIREAWCSTSRDPASRSWRRSS